MKGIAVLNDRFNFSFIHKTDNDEFNRINEIIKDMERIQFIHSAKVPLVENYREIMNLIDDYKNNKILPIVIKYYIIVRIQNFLSSVRGYVDTFAHTLSTEYGKDSEIYNKFSDLKSSMYDKYFSYRFIEILRNFAQHRTIPISSIYISSENKKKVLQLIIKKEDLLADKKIKGKKREDIEANCSEQTDLLPHITNMFSYLMSIHDVMVYSVIEEEKCIEFFKFESLFNGIEGSLVLLEVEDEGDRKNFNPRLFDFNGIKQIISQLNETATFLKTLNQELD